MQIYKSKLLKKAALTCILLGTVPSVIVGTFSYQKASEAIQQKVDEGCVSQLQQVQMSVETQLASTKKTLLQLIESPSVTQSISTPKSGLEFQTFYQIENVINSLPPTSIPIYNVSLINIEKEWVIDKTNIYGLPEYEQQNPSVKDYIKSSKKAFWNDKAKVLDTTGETQTTCVAVIQKYKSRDGSYIGTIDIPYSSFRNLIKTTKTPGITMIINSEGNVIFSGQPEKSHAFSSKMIALIQQDGKKTGCLNMPTGNSTWNVTYIRSDYNQWFYALATPMDELTRDSKTIQWFTVLVCIMLTALIVLISLFISNRAYRPVQRLSSVLKDETAPAVPGDEVKQIENKVTSLIVNRSNLQKEMVSQSQKLREYFIAKLLMTENSADFIDSRASLYGFLSPPPVMAVMVIQPDPFENTPYKESDADILLYAISNITSEIFADHSIIFTSILDEKQITILSVDEEEYKNEVYGYAGQIQKTLQRELEFGVSVVISRPVRTYKDLHKNYNECVHILQYKLLSRKSITFVDDVNKQLDLNSVYPQDLEKEILDAVQTCDRVKCREMIHQFLTSIFDVQSNRCVYKIFLLRLVVNLVILENHASKDLCRSESEYIRQIYNMHDKDQIEDWLENTVAESVIQNIEKSEDNHLREICNSVLDIIHKEYSNKLTLETCAQKLNYHPSYIRRVLKKEMGINFRDYLVKYQINVAKKWLVETEYTTAEIARKLQYENTENFIRCFKKVVGCTPRQYKNNRANL